MPSVMMKYRITYIHCNAHCNNEILNQNHSIMPRVIMRRQRYFYVCIFGNPWCNVLTYALAGIMCCNTICNMLTEMPRRAQCAVIQYVMCWQRCQGVRGPWVRSSWHDTCTDWRYPLSPHRDCICTNFASAKVDYCWRLSTTRSHCCCHRRWSEWLAGFEKSWYWLVWLLILRRT